MISCLSVWFVSGSPDPDTSENQVGRLSTLARSICGSMSHSPTTFLLFEILLPNLLVNVFDYMNSIY